ncbi:hypothetical protein BBJ28_00022200, partial [Nothophytophthora sp. Chile5]
MPESRRPPAKAQKTQHSKRETATSNGHSIYSQDASTTSETEDEMDVDEQDDDYEEEDVAVGTKRRKASAASGQKRKPTGKGKDRHVADEGQLHDGETAAELSQADAGIDTEMGVVEEIYCENFMCHRKMRVALCPHINFITGENGSGKSAIIAAIQICLGASARVTHRGKSIKNLIRHGHEGNALVRITLRNDAKGSDAFRPEQFGKKIMVERLIRRDGSAEYRLKDERGVLVSKLKSDLEAMLDHLNIQTENPCAILDQENAKLFLKGNPADKYKFFLQSTDLYKMRTTYSKIDEETRTISESTLKREQAKIVTLKDAMKEAEKQWQEAQSIGKLEDEFEELKKELAWSFVSEKEAQAAKVAKKMQRKKRAEEVAAADYAEAKTMVQNLELKQKHKNDKLEETSALMSQNNQRKTDVKNRIREARRPLHSCKAEIKQLVQSKERANQRLHRLQRDLEKKKLDHEAMLRNRMQRNDDMRVRIEDKRQEVAHAEQELNEAKHRSQARPEELEELEARHDNCLHQLREADSEVGRSQHRMNALRNQNRDSLAVYGAKIPQLQHLIHENRHRFAAPPIGPLGIHVKLPERFMHFAVAIEQALKGTLQNYLVVNGRDKALLEDLKRQVNCPHNQANIIIAQRTGRRYGHLRLAPGTLASHAICNILEVSDDEVFNALIDVCSTEGKLLFDDRQSAEEGVLSGSSGNFKMARFVSEVYLPNGDKFLVRSGNLAYIANKGSRRSSIICQDVEAEMKELEQKLDYLRGNLDVLRRDESQLRREREAHRNQVKQQNDRIDHLSRRCNQRAVELRNLEEDLSDDLQQHTLDTSVLEDEVRAVEDELQGFHDREQELNDILSKSNPDLEGQLHELEELDALEKEIATEMNEYQEDVDALYKHLSEMKVQELTHQRDAAALRDMVAQWEGELAAIQEDCDEQREKAEQHCECVTS